MGEVIFRPSRNSQLLGFVFSRLLLENMASMASSLYLEHYLDSIENLPYELQRNFTLLRDLDQRAHDLLSEIDKICEEYVSKIKGLTPPEKRDYLEKIDSAFKKSREYGDDKVQLAIQTYEMVDR